MDPEWHRLAKQLTTALTGAELARVIAGPRRHPYAVDGAVYQTIEEGRVVIWPSVEACRLYAATR